MTRDHAIRILCAGTVGKVRETLMMHYLTFPRRINRDLPRTIAALRGKKTQPPVAVQDDSHR